MDVFSIFKKVNGAGDVWNPMSLIFAIFNFANVVQFANNAKIKPSRKFKVMQYVYDSSPADLANVAAALPCRALQ